MWFHRGDGQFPHLCRSKHHFRCWSQLMFGAFRFSSKDHGESTWKASHLGNSTPLFLHPGFLNVGKASGSTIPRFTIKKLVVDAIAGGSMFSKAWYELIWYIMLICNYRYMLEHDISSIYVRKAWYVTTNHRKTINIFKPGKCFAWVVRNIIRWCWINHPETYHVDGQNGLTWRLPQMGGAPVHHPFDLRIFHEINHPETMSMPQDYGTPHVHPFKKGPWDFIRLYWLVGRGW